ncbi:hypothetical protein M9Y10_010140 [Tritrichomonas musculus]|uniref:DUF3447 domain-containing protein n=1 Tax=Tritrichomonas musculus TaxID=1915356 RepID=A0ABR2IQE4_9EUKA
MNIQEYIEKFTTLQINILEFIDSKEDSEEKLQNISKNIEDFKIKEYRHEFQSLLYLISKISSNHFRVPDFFSKIHKILQLLKEDISQKFENLEIFDIFRSNKKLLLILIDEQILKFDENVANEIKKSKCFENFSKFFYPEIKPFLTADQLNQIVFNQDYFEEKRKLGENDTEICQIIREDSIKEFIEFVQNNNFKINHTIEPSIYETNSFLLKCQKEFDRQPTYIEYAAFFGSIEIFEYLISNTVTIDSNLLLFAVHSNSPIIMSFFEEIQIDADNKFYKKCLNEAIKCHHNEMANYIQQNYINQKPRKSEIINYFKLEKNDQEFYMKGVVACSLKYYNFAFFPNKPNDKYLLFYAAKFNYYKIVEFLLNSRKINVNEKVISNKIFFSNKILN